MIRFRIAVVAAGVVLPHAAAAQFAPPLPSPDPARVIIPATVREDVEFLASDALAGRATPSPGLERAAAYIAHAFRDAGLQPAGDSSTFVQRYAIQTARVPAATRRIGWRGAAGETLWRHGRDYILLPAPADSAVGPAVFVGAAGPMLAAMPAEVRGGVAIALLHGDPAGSSGDMTAALVAAIRAGARAAVFVLDADVPAEKVAELAEQVEATEAQAPIPVVMVRRQAAAGIFRGKEECPTGVLPGVTIVVRAPMVVSTSRAPNVAAILPGSDPVLRDSFVVITAHFDHVGVGRPNAHGDSVFNGADDNASGAAALLAAARAFGAADRRPRRSILFLAVSGEEKGLKGSAAWAQQPTVPLGRVVANLNLDMVGRNAPDSLTVMGTEYSTLGTTVQSALNAHPELGFHVTSHAPAGSRWWGRSDHVTFVSAGIPSLFFTTLEEPDYHHPSDEAAKLDVDKLARVARLLFHVTQAIADGDSAPRWNEGGKTAAQAATIN